MDKITGKIEFNQTCHNCGYSYPNNVNHSCPTVVASTVPLKLEGEHTPTYHGLQSQLTTANRKLAIAEAELRHYADADNWFCQADGDNRCGHYVAVFTVTPLEITNGYDIAQTALKEMEAE